MTLPCQPVVKLRLGTGAAFANVLVLGDPLNGILGTNVLGSAATEIVDITNTVQRITIRRGRDRVFEEYTPGTATIQLIDLTGDFNPSNTTSPYYPNILPMRQVQITTTYLGVDYFLFTGYIQAWDYNFQVESDIAYVTIRATDGFRLLNLANIDTVTGAANDDYPGQRIEQILNTIDWPAQLRDIDLGDVQLQNDPGGSRTALGAIQTIEQTELGHFYIAPDGKATFRSRGAISQQASGTAIDFNDDGTNVSYNEIDITLDETELSNVVSVTRLSGATQTVSDAASIANYFTRSYARTGLMMRTNQEAEDQAQLILNYRANVRTRVDSIGLDLSSVSNRVPQGLGLDIGDPIHVHKQFMDNSTIDVRVTVQGVNHDITPDTWFTTFTTAYPLSTAFILGSSEFGVLGTSTL